MNNYEFYEILLGNINLFILLLFLSVVCHYFLFKRIIFSIVDPYLLSVVSSVFGVCIVCFLYFTGNISKLAFFSFTLTQAAFWIGLLTFKNPLKGKGLFSFSGKKPIKYSTQDLKTDPYKVSAFYFFAILFLLTQSAVYLLKGIPIFMASRLETFAAGGGAGILGRITDVASIFSIYSFFTVIKLDKFRLSEVPKYLLMGLIFLTFLLSGSKSAFLTVFLIFGCFILFAALKQRDYQFYLFLIKKYLRSLLAFCLVFVLGIIYVQSAIGSPEDQVNPLFALGLRLVHSGDIFWYSYPNNIYLKINGANGFQALFNDLLGFLRFYDYSQLPEAIGITFKNIHHPSDIPQGPNARHNVFGLIYYGFIGSIIFSYVLGWIISFTRNTLPMLLKYNTVNGFIFTYLVIKMSAMDSDPMLGLTYINNLVFVFPVLFIIYLFFYECFIHRPDAAYANSR